MKVGRLLRDLNFSILHFLRVAPTGHCKTLIKILGYKQVAPTGQNTDLRFFGLTFTFNILDFTFYISRATPLGQKKAHIHFCAIKVSPLWGGIQAPDYFGVHFYI
jgi:hypothetical protein